MSILKTLTGLCIIKQSLKVKNTFSSEKGLVEHKEACLNINGKQTVKLRSGSIKFKNYYKQISVLFKIYADFECIVKRLRSTDRGDRDDNAS